MLASGHLGPHNQGFSDRGCGCSWIVPITCGFATAMLANSSALRVVTCVNGVSSGATRNNALAASPGFSLLFVVRGPVTAPEIDLARSGLGGIPSIWRSPTTRQLGGSPRRNRRMRHLPIFVVSGSVLPCRAVYG